MSQLWYFVGFHGERVIHAEHDYTGHEDANHRASVLFNHGTIIDGNTVEFTRVVAISEGHEIGFDAKGLID